MKTQNEKGKVYDKTHPPPPLPFFPLQRQQQPAVISCQQSSCIRHAKHTEHKRLDESCLIKLLVCQRSPLRVGLEKRVRCTSTPM